mmetsp:Transcript_3343/g.10493  ORF Transcript_3343/g.10493 Transcript_3343/m.10493 type:complete len:210 (-) Transcript_3343:1038-1667(-)
MALRSSIRRPMAPRTSPMEASHMSFTVSMDCLASAWCASNLPIISPSSWCTWSNRFCDSSWLIATSSAPSSPARSTPACTMCLRAPACVRAISSSACATWAVPSCGVACSASAPAPVCTARRCASTKSIALVSSLCARNSSSYADCAWSRCVSRCASSSRIWSCSCSTCSSMELVSGLGVLFARSMASFSSWVRREVSCRHLSVSSSRA